MRNLLSSSNFLSFILDGEPLGDLGLLLNGDLGLLPSELEYFLSRL